MQTTHRVAVLTDIHGNLPALEAVLDDIGAVGADAMVLLGDLASGPLPGATLDRLADLAVPVVASVQGNADRQVVEAYDGTAGDDAHEVDAEMATLIERRHRHTLDGLQRSAVVEVEGLGAVRCCHATPRSDTEIVLGDDDEALLEAVLDGTREYVVLCGHTHVPFDRRLARHRLVNPGSVGMPYGSTGADWALLGPDVELRHTDYDLAAAARLLERDSRWSGGAAFAAENLLVVPSTEEAYAVFRDHPWRPDLG